MAQKIYDIIPPKEEPKVTNPQEKNSGVLPVRVVKQPKAVFASNLPQDNIPEFSQAPQQGTASADDNQQKNDFLLEKTEKEMPQRKKIKFSFKKWAIIFGCLSVVIICVYFFFSLQKAEVSIWPKTELLSYEDKIMVEKSVSEINVENKKIPATLFEIEKDLWQDFPATGSAQNSGKASGLITIYNKLNPTTAFTLKTGTHFLSDSGKYFITSEKVTIPAGTLKNGKLTPGSITVKVIAESVGKDFNIEASKFSIPKLVGTNYYYSIYAESTSSMTGGFLSDVKKVTDLDLSNAKTQLSEKTLSEAETSLRQKIPSDYVLFDNAISKKITETFSPIKSGAIIDNFSYQVKVKAMALAFKRQDIEKFARDIINSQVAGKNILEQSYKINFTPESVDLANGKMVLNSDFSVKIYQPVDINDLKLLFMQKNAGEIKDIAKSRLPDQLERLDIKFWPFWTNKAPKNNDKININLRFDN